MKNKKTTTKNNLLNYLLAGIVAATILFVIITLNKNNDTIVDPVRTPVWTAEMDSTFVKNCYDKYRPQIKDDFVKQEIMKTFCRCMLEKVKTKYEQEEIIKIKDEEIKKWDAECRELILNPNK